MCDCLTIPKFKEFSSAPSDDDSTAAASSCNIELPDRFVLFTFQAFVAKILDTLTWKWIILTRNIKVNVWAE